QDDLRLRPLAHHCTQELQQKADRIHSRRRGRAAEWGRLRWLEVERLPGHLVALVAKVKLKPITSQDRVADHAMQLGSRQAETVHAFKLEGVLDAAFDFLHDHAALNFKAVERSPALFVRLDPQLVADRR